MKNINNEIWRPIEGYEGLYEVSNLGRVKSLVFKGHKRKKILKQSKSPNYYWVYLCKDGIHKPFYVHRLVAKTFVPNPYNYSYVNHKDENKTNNFVYVNTDGTVDIEKSNLEWCTHQYNDSYGTKNDNIKKEIIQYDSDGNIIKKWKSASDASKELGICRQGINKCCLGKRKSAGGFIWKYKEAA